MAVPIIGEKNYPYIIVGMSPGKLPGTFDIELNMENFPGGVVLAVQCLLQAAMFVLPKAFEAVAVAATQELLNRQRTNHSGDA